MLCGLVAACAPPAAAPDSSADRVRGKVALQQHACPTCHRIAGVVGPDAHVGPPLIGLGARAYIAGRLPNTPEHLVRWIRDPKAFKPQTAMPDLDVPLQDARDMAAYLHTPD